MPQCMDDDKTIRKAMLPGPRPTSGCAFPTPMDTTKPNLHKARFDNEGETAAVTLGQHPYGRSQADFTSKARRRLQYNTGRQSTNLARRAAGAGRGCSQSRRTVTFHQSGNKEAQPISCHKSRGTLQNLAGIVGNRVLHPPYGVPCGLAAQTAVGVRQPMLEFSDRLTCCR